MMIHLITRLDEQGIAHGTTPEIQDLEFWVASGYRYIACALNNSISISKFDIGDIGEHCGYSNTVIPNKCI